MKTTADLWRERLTRRAMIERLCRLGVYACGVLCVFLFFYGVTN